MNKQKRVSKLSSFYRQKWMDSILLPSWLWITSLVATDRIIPFDY
jgi:hypothetical protein